MVRTIEELNKQVCALNSRVDILEQAFSHIYKAAAISCETKVEKPESSKKRLAAVPSLAVISEEKAQLPPPLENKEPADDEMSSSSSASSDTEEDIK